MAPSPLHIPAGEYPFHDPWIPSFLTRLANKAFANSLPVKTVLSGDEVEICVKD